MLRTDVRTEQPFANGWGFSLETRTKSESLLAGEQISPPSSVLEAFEWLGSKPQNPTGEGGLSLREFHQSSERKVGFKGSESEPFCDSPPLHSTPLHSPLWGFPYFEGLGTEGCVFFVRLGLVFLVPWLLGWPVGWSVGNGTPLEIPRFRDRSTRSTPSGGVCGVSRGGGCASGLA